MCGKKKKKKKESDSSMERQNPGDANTLGLGRVLASQCCPL